MSLFTKTGRQPTVQSTPMLAKFILGFVLIYGSLEGTARLLNDALRPQNAFLITGVVLIVALVVEMSLFKEGWQAALLALGVGWSNWRALAVALLLAALQLAAYPLITWLTGYHWTLPANWGWTMVGIFALHGIAEEVLYRGFLFGYLRQGRTFWQAAWLAVILFTLSHLPILATQGTGWWHGGCTGNQFILSLCPSLRAGS